MATNTPTYSFLKPTVGGDTSVWGGYLNTNFDDIDGLLDGTSPVTGIDINGGSIDGTPIGAAVASTGAFSTLSATTADINGGTIDGTPIGAAVASTGAFSTLSATTADINGGTIDGTVVGGTSRAAGSFTAFTSNGIDDNASSTAFTVAATGQVSFGTTAVPVLSNIKTVAAGNGAYGQFTRDSVAIGGAYLGTDGNSFIFGTHTGAVGAETYSEKLRLTNAGNLGLGTGSPNDGFHINLADPTITLQDSNNPNTPSSKVRGYDGILSLEADTSGVQANSYIGFSIDTAEIARFTTAGDFRVTGAVYKDGPGALSVGSSGCGLNFDPASNFILPISVTGGVVAANDATLDLGRTTTRFRNIFLSGTMRADGGMLVGTGSSFSGARASFFKDAGDVIAIRNATTSYVAIRFQSNAAANVGAISCNATNTIYATSSDPRLKENITPIQGATDILRALNPVTYTFKADGSWMDGFLTNEVQTLLPSAVTGEPDAMMDEEYEVSPAVLDDEGAVVTEAVIGTRSVPDYQGLDYSRLTPILTASLKDAWDKIDALTARIAALETA